MGTTTQLMTFEEFEALPETPERLELLEGELVRMPPAELLHMDIVHMLFRLLDASFTGPGKVYMETGYLLTADPRSWVQPDVSITHADQPRGKYFEGAPQVAFEVASPSNTAPALQKKVRLYLRHGAAEVWVIYPELREAWVYRAGSGTATKHDVIESELLPNIHISLDQILQPIE